MKQIALDKNAVTLLRAYKLATGIRNQTEVVRRLLEGAGVDLELIPPQDINDFSVVKLDDEVWKQLKAYRDRRQLGNYSWTIRHLFDEAGMGDVVQKMIKKYGGVNPVTWQKRKASN